MKIERNDPCPCGSTKNGKPVKYKNCCLRKDEEKQKQELHDELINFLKEIDKESGKMRTDAEYEQDYKDYIEAMRNQ